MLDQWDRFDLSECEEIARDLDRVLPASFRFHKIESCAAGDQKHHVAIFEWAGLPQSYQYGFFALIPGGEATLGYDSENPFLPTAQQQASWVEETQKTEMFTGALDVFLDDVMTPLRHVNLEPFLLEVLATPLAPVPIFDTSLGGSGGWRRSIIPIMASETLQRLSCNPQFTLSRISPDVLMQYPLVVDFLVQHGYKKLKPGSERGVELYSLVQEAIQVCKLSGLLITKKELSRIVGVSGTTLYYYPTVRVLMTQAVKEDKRQRQKNRFQLREDELTLQVTNAIQQLRDMGKKVSVSSCEPRSCFP